jgi:hypothetical protein
MSFAHSVKQKAVNLNGLKGYVRGTNGHDNWYDGCLYYQMKVFGIVPDTIWNGKSKSRKASNNGKQKESTGKGPEDDRSGQN